MAPNGGFPKTTPPSRGLPKAARSAGGFLPMVSYPSRRESVHESWKLRLARERARTAKVIERAGILARGGALEFDLPGVAARPATNAAKAAVPTQPGTAAEFLTEVEMEQRARDNLRGARTSGLEDRGCRRLRRTAGHQTYNLACAHEEVGTQETNSPRLPAGLSASSRRRKMGLAGIQPSGLTQEKSQNEEAAR